MDNTIRDTIEKIVKEHILYKNSKYKDKVDLTWSVQCRFVHRYLKANKVYQLPKTSLSFACIKATYKETSAVIGYVIFNELGELYYMCCSGTFTSQDGEYRNRIIYGIPDIISKITENHEYRIAETLTVQKMNNGLSFQVDFCFSSFIKDAGKAKDIITNDRIPIKMYAMCWLRDAPRIHHKLIENHINPAYQYVIYQGEQTAIDVMLDNKSYQRVIRIITGYYDSVTPCGQKIIPLTLRETFQPEEPFGVWKEILIYKHLKKTMINLTNVNYPIFLSWTYMEETHGGIYDNLAMHNKYSQSNIGDKISRGLREVDKLAYTDNKPINNKFAKISKNIKKSRYLTDSTVRISDISLYCLMTDMGSTLKDVHIHVQEPFVKMRYTNIFTDYNTFMTITFEYIYTLYCAHTNDIIHGDLHVNNATIYSYLAKKPPSEVRKLYIVGDDEYFVPNIMLTPCIIDFSRGIVRNNKIFGTSNKYDNEVFIKEQTNRVIAIINRYFPTLCNQNLNKIHGAIISNFNELFVPLSSIDVCSLFMGINSMMNKNEHTTTEDTVKIKTTIKNVMVQSELLALEGIKKIINNENYMERLPAAEILRKQYAMFVTPPNNYQISDIFDASDNRYADDQESPVFTTLQFNESKILKLNIESKDVDNSRVHALSTNKKSVFESSDFTESWMFE